MDKVIKKSVKKDVRLQEKGPVLSVQAIELNC